MASEMMELPAVKGDQAVAVSNQGSLADLEAKIRRAKLQRQIMALPLVAPLLLLLIFAFLIPIVLLLARSVDNREVAEIMPRTSAAIASWGGETPPDSALFEALAEDLRAGKPEQVALVAKTLNYHKSGLRTAVMAAARSARANPSGSALDYLPSANAAWGNVETWGAVKQALPRFTDFYLLAALDLKRNAVGDIVAASPESSVYREVLYRTFYISFLTTMICLLVAYPLAYIISKATPRGANFILLMVLLSFWTPLLVRNTSWLVVLQSNGVLNSFFALIGIISPSEPLELVHNRVGVLIAMVHTLLPFMVLPIYSAMRSMSPNYMRAALSLGAPPFKAFLRVYLPLSLPGVSAGCLLVFILALGYYITPALVGGPSDQMIAGDINQFTSGTINWGMAAALSLVLVISVLVLYFLYARIVGIEKLKMG